MRFLLLLLILSVCATPAFASTGDPQDEPSWWTTVFYEALDSFWSWIVDSVDVLFNTLLNFIFDAIPDDYQASAVPFRQYIEIANCWISLDYGLTLLGAYYTFLSVFVVIKFVLKLVPTVG